MTSTRSSSLFAAVLWLLASPALAQPEVSLPVPCGDSVRVTQGVGGSVSHTGGQFFAYDLSTGGDSFPVAAAADGTVAAIYNRDGAACTCCSSCTTACRTSVRAVIVRHADGFFTGYYHLASIRVHVGDHVNRGERLGMSGQTGHSCGIHLHFQAQTTASLWGPSRDVHFREAGGGRLVVGRTYTSAACCADRDGDGRDDCSDNCPGEPNRGQADLDEDGRGDACDDDGDGVNDGRDNCPRAPNAGQADRDGDGRGNACDGDDDGDRVRDENDNCPGVPNPDQANFNGDREGDVCDDTDDDGIRDHRDNCRRDVNRGQADLDGDGRGDVCDGDKDGDGVANEPDNCPGVPNPDQANLDGDGRGDACEDDDDGDGRDDESDNCPGLANPDQADSDGDGLGDACDPAAMTPEPPVEGAGPCEGSTGGIEVDVDGDGVADACDGDDDGDGVPNSMDGCPGDAADDCDVVGGDGDAGVGADGGSAMRRPSAAGGCSASPRRGSGLALSLLVVAVVMAARRRRAVGRVATLAGGVMLAGAMMLSGCTMETSAIRSDAGPAAPDTRASDAPVLLADTAWIAPEPDAGTAPADMPDAPITALPEPPPEPEGAPSPVERTYRVLHWNVAGGKIHDGRIHTGIIEAIADLTVDRDAHFLGLNELCRTQFDALEAMLRRRGWPEDPDRFARFVAAREHSPGCGGGAYGNAVFSRLPLGPADRFTWPSDGSDEDRVMVCAPLVRLPHMRFCSTHLTHRGGESMPRQLRAAVEQLEAYEDAGDTVIFAGDLNATPPEAIMNRIYSSMLDTRVNGDNVGRYRELDDSDPVCLGHGERTTPRTDGGACGEGPKIDYVFVRQNRIVGDYSADALNIPDSCGGACSDHRPLAGTVTVRVRVAP